MLPRPHAFGAPPRASFCAIAWAGLQVSTVMPIKNVPKPIGHVKVFIGLSNNTGKLVQLRLDVCSGLVNKWDDYGASRQ